MPVSDLAVVLGVVRLVFGDRLETLSHAVDPAVRRCRLAELARETVRRRVLDAPNHPAKGPCLGRRPRTRRSTARWPSGCHGGCDPAWAVQLMAADLGLVQQGFGDRVEAVQEPMALGFGDIEAILGGGQ